MIHTPHSTRQTGFHPVAKSVDKDPTQNELTLSKPDPVFPYSKLGEGIQALLEKPTTTPLLTSKSSSCLDQQVQGKYRQLSNGDKDPRGTRDRPLSSSWSAHNLFGFTQTSGKHRAAANRPSSAKTANGLVVSSPPLESCAEQKGCSSGSKWSQFIDEEEENDVSEEFSDEL